MKTLFSNSPQLIVKQVKEVFEIVINWETANKYALYDVDSKKIGFVAERTNGIFHRLVRNILRSHRSLVIDIWDERDEHILIGTRPWYFFFSDLKVTTANNIHIGEIKTRFGILKRKYDLLDKNGKVFATLESFRWRLWTFTIYDHLGKEIGVISKKWGGILKEVLTDSDQFVIDYSKYEWGQEEKAIILFTCISIDLDFFEDNSSSVAGLFD